VQAFLLERRADNGYRAWVNCVGHTAIDPLELPSPAWQPA
jgi:hypothetical protein